MRYGAVVATPVGRLGICIVNQALARIEFLPLQQPEQDPDSNLAEQAVTELLNYFNDPAAPFTLPLDLHGTDFQCRVWSYLCTLKVGSRVSYGDAAKRLATAARAVGGACRANPLPIIIPCHRIVSAQGWGGYAGEVDGNNLDIKRWLLEHELQIGTRS